MRKFIFIFILGIMSTAAVAHAAEGFVPIAPIPGPNGAPITQSTSLEDYINAAFRIALGVGAVLAVIYIGVGGFEYMLSQTLPGQKDGRARIWNALYGLAILILVFLVLYIINPNIVSLNIF